MSKTISPYQGTNSLDRAYLRPLRQPLFDAEWLMPGAPLHAIDMFGRPTNSGFRCRPEITKDKHFTNLNQAGMLDYPIEFHIYGFNYAMGEEVDPEDRAKVLSGSFDFTFCGRRSYLQCPLIGMPSERRRKPVSEIVARVVKLSGEIAEKTVDVSPKRCEKDRAALKKEIDDDLIFDFLVGDHKLQIKPSEAFGVQYTWPESIVVKKPVLLYAFIDGLMWVPL